MIIVNFENNEEYKKAYGLWQYDYGQVLRIQGLDLPTAVEMHFSLTETGGEAVTRIGITKDGVTDVTIPDSLLEADGASQDYQIYVFIYLATPDSGETTRRITLGVKSRPRPEVFDTPGEEELFEGAVQAVNDAAKRAEEAGKEATAAAGEAKESASLAGKHLADTQALAEQVEINADTVTQGTETARELLAQTQKAASNAVVSAEMAKQSETAAREAQTAAETAEDTARQYAEETEADRQEVAKSKQSVEQMQNDVAKMQADVRADKEAVEQTVSEFGTAAQDALTAIGQAQNTAVSAVQTEGQKQATAVHEAGAQAIDEIDTAKTAAVGAVASEGDKQVVRVQEAAAEIVADREQIQHNKADIATLTDKTNTLAPGIVLGTKGGTIAVSNASEQPLVGLTVYGKSIQASEPSVEHPQEVVSAGDNGKIEVEVFGTNICPVSSETTNFMTFTKVYPGVPYSICAKQSIPTVLNIMIVEENDTSAKNPIEVFNNLQFVKGVITFEPTKTGYVYVNSHKETEYSGVCIYAGTLLEYQYEPYKPAQTLTLKTPNGLAGIPTKGNGNYTDENGQQWICDTIECRDGIAEYVQRIGEIVVNSDAHIAADLADYGALQENTVIGRYFNESIKKETAILCKELQIIENWSNDKESARTVEKGIDFRLSRERIGLGTETTNEQNKTAILKFLETTPLHFVVQLDTPIRTPLTQEEMAAYKALHTYSPNTTVVNDAGCGMSLTYIADTQRYIDKKIAAISAAMIGG